MSEFDYTFYLVKTRCWDKPWWVEKEGNYWINYMGGRTPISKDDEVMDTKVQEKIEDLDWSITGMIEDQTRCGWLDPEGRFYGCAHMAHRIVARWVFHKGEKQLEQEGWIRVLRKNDWISARDRITEAQRSWLIAHGHDVNEEEWGRL